MTEPDVDLTAGPDLPARRRLLGPLVLISVPAAVIVAAVLVSVGPSHRAPGAAQATATTATTHFLASLAAVIGLAFVAGRLARKLGQPVVIGEIVAGILLGPTVFGSWLPHSSSWLFPTTSMTMLRGLSELGLILFMAGVGREFAQSTGRSRPAQDVLVAGSSLLVPFAAGALLALGLGHRYLGTSGSPTAFVLFMGCVFGVTAFPVLAKLISDAGLSRSRIGQLSMYSAALGDGAVWLLLIPVGAVAGASSNAHNAWAVVTVVALMLALWQSGRLASWFGRVSHSAGAGTDAFLGAVALAVTVMATATAFGGVHEIVGGFVAGVLLGRPGGWAGAAVDRLLPVAGTVLFPIFLVLFGMSVDFGAVSWGASTLALLVLIVVTGSGAKIVGAGSAARLNGMSWRDSATVGTLASARGATELVVLQVGSQLGVINSTMLVTLTAAAMLMTVAVGPMVVLLRRPVATAEPALGTEPGPGFVAAPAPVSEGGVS